MGNFSRGVQLLSVIFLVFNIAGCLSATLEILPSSPVQERPVGKKLLLTCRAKDDGNRITSLRWLDPRNRTITNDNPDRLSTEMMSANTLALIFSSLRESEAGTYTCLAEYSNSQNVSKSVTIETIVAITWVDAPQEQSPILGRDYKVKCIVNANPSPVVDWLRDRDLITPTDRFVIDTDGLLIKNVTLQDDGTYTCRARVMNTGELAERNIKVEVHTLPKFDEKMVSQVEVIDGEPASITCLATGKPPPTYQWIRSATSLNLGASNERFSVNERTGVLTITRVSREDNGPIKCAASNAAGIVEKEVNLVVVVKPQVVDIKNISVQTGREAKLECRATGNPLPTVTFWKLSEPQKMVAGLQPTDDRISVQQTEDRERSQVIGTLTILNLMTSDDGLYACIAENKGGEARKNGHLTVEYPPTFVNTPMKEAWSWSRNPVNLTCLAEAIPNATISWKLNERDIERDPNFKKFGNGPQSTLLVTPVDPYFYGAYKCIAKNVHGEVSHTIRLQEAHVPSEIHQVKDGVITATTITFSLLGPRNSGGRPIKAYLVQYKKETQPWTEALNRTCPVDAPCILEKLEPQSTYDFRFAAINDVGRGPWGAHKHLQMPKRSNPEEPKILNQLLPEGYVASPYPDKFELRWSIPADNGEPIELYQIKYCRVHKVNGEWTHTDPGCQTLEHKSAEQTTFELMNLYPDSYYRIEIRARNVIGDSTPGEITLKTARGSDSEIHKSDQAHTNSAIIVILVVAVLIIIFIIVDVSCYFVNDTGLLWLMCGKGHSRKSRDDDVKLGSEGKELLNNGNREGKIHIEATPMIDNSMKKDMTVEFDMKKSVSKTSFVGKDSAV